MKTPTDLVILRLIYKLYYEEFKNFSIEAGVENGRKSKIFVPIDCKLIATQLKVDAELAGLEEENSKAQTAIYLSLFATAVAIIAVVVTWLTAK